MYKFIIALGLIIALTTIGCTNSTDPKDEAVPEATEEVVSESPGEVTDGDVSKLQEQIKSNMSFKIAQVNDNCLQVIIDEKEYEVCKGDEYNGDKPLPFEYEFKDDGNVIISYEGNKYDINSSKDGAINTIKEGVNSLIKRE